MQMKLNRAVLLRIIIIFTCVSGLYNGVSANEHDLLPVQQNRKLLKLNGNVSSVKEEKWVLKLDTSVYSTATTIDVDSNFIMTRSEEALFDGPGNITMLRTISLVNYKDNITKDSSRYFYYKEEKLTGIANLLDNKRYDSMVIHYNRSGLLDYFKVLDVNNGIEYKMEYDYKDKKVASLRRTGPKNETIFSTVFSYRNNNLFQSMNYDANDKLLESRKYSTNKDNYGNTQESFAGMDVKGKLKGGMTITKDAAGNILEQSMVDESSNIYESYRFTYDAYGNRLNANIFSGIQSFHIEYRYTYDAHHNWIRKESFTNDVLISVIIRTIHYDK